MSGQTDQNALENGANAGREGGEDLPLLPKDLKVESFTFMNRLAMSFQDWFSWELVSAIVALVSISAIIVVLAVFDNSSLPDWPFIFTINTIVSLFSSIAKLAIMSIVGTCVSQSKWLWYHQEPKQLQDLQLFDDASRGPWGALSLILTLTARTLGSLGAAVVVLSLLFDPFLQQVVNYRDRLVPVDKEATIVRAQRYLAPSHEGLSLPSVVDLSMKAAIYEGTFDADNQANTGTNFQCSTGNCTFNTFSSLAVCSKCVNITDMIERSSNSSACVKLSLPSGPSISGRGGQINTSITDISPTLQDLQASVVQFTSLFSKDHGGFQDAQAWECALYYCVNVYKVTVTDGNLNQKIQTTWRNDSASATQDSNLIYNPPASIINITANSSEFYVDSLAAKALNRFMSDAVSGNGSLGSPDSGSVFSSDIVHALYQASGLSSRMDNLAVSMSNNIRQQNDSGSDPFSGVALKGETYMHVSWGWFAYPVALLLISLVSLIATIVETGNRKIKVWKSSTLALLYQGGHLGFNNGKEGAADTLSQMSHKSSGLHLELVRNKDQVLQLQSR